MTRLANLGVAAVLLAGLLWLSASVSGALMPFVFGAVVAYITAPLAAKIENHGASSTVSAALIVLLVIVLLALFMLALIPLFVSQIRGISAILPTVLEKGQAWLGEDFEALIRENNVDIKSIGMNGAEKIFAFVSGALGGGVSFLTAFFIMSLVGPLATFYFLCDREKISGELTEMLPPDWRERALSISRDLDNVLGEFLHGQLIVMVIMAVFYSVVLKLAGVEFALSIGIVSGLLVFIPYVGFIIGLALATLVGISSLESWLDIAIVWALMGIGTTLESMLITPRFVGERVGLHPLAVLLAIMVFGELFGFIGVLMALPMAAVMLVCLRHLRRFYIGSNFYQRR